MKNSVLTELNKLATELDKLGHTKLSDSAESIMNKIAQTFGEETDSSL